MGIIEHTAARVSHALLSCSTTHKQVAWLKLKKNEEVWRGVCL